MAATPRPERPPSEQGVEYDLLDALRRLDARLDQLGERGGASLGGLLNWWDELPAELADIAAEGCTYATQLPCKQPHQQLLLQIMTARDRIELTLRLNGAWTVWQRCLFIGPKRAAA